AHDLLLAVHEVLHRDVGFDLIVHAVEAADAEAREEQRGLAKRLGRDGAGVDPRAAGMRGHLDEGNAAAEVRGLRRTLLAGGPAPDPDQIVPFHRAFPYAGGFREARTSVHERYRRPPARRRASGKPRNRAIATTPRNGPTASVAKAQRQPSAPASGGMSQ